MDLDCANSMLDRGPCVVTSSNIFELLQLRDCEVVQDSVGLDYALDDISNKLQRSRILIRSDSGKVSRRFPRITLSGNPIERNLLNRILAERFEMAKSLFPRQSEIPDLLCQIPLDETVVMVVVDGLSYNDARGIMPDCVPMIADGPTTTEDGILRLAGIPTIAQRMFERGYRILGYSFWSRSENPLTDIFFSPIPSENFLKYSEFNQVLMNLKERDMSSGYVQIFLEGLDQFCHKHRDSPDIDSKLKSLGEKFISIVDLLETKEVRGNVCVTADHGILWRSEGLRILDVPALKDRGPRLTSGAILRDETISFSLGPRSTTCLKYPYVTRKIRSNEWGVHGGISYEESIVPWYSRAVG